MSDWKNKIAELRAWAKDDIVPLDLQWLCEVVADELALHRWILTSERLPKEGKEVLVYYTYEANGNSYIGIAFISRKMWYSDDGKTVFKFKEVTRWMELPTLPKGE